MVQRPFDIQEWLKIYLRVFHFFKNNTHFNNILAEAHPSYQIPPNQITQVDVSIGSISHFLKSTKIIHLNIPLIEIPIYDDDISGNFPTHLIGGDIEGNKDTLRKFSAAVCIIFTSNQQPRSGTSCAASQGILNANSCCLRDHSCRKRVVRRFHFDYQPDEHDPPLVTHFQYGGPILTGGYPNELHYCLEHLLEKPRIPCNAWDYVKLLDCFIRQFDTPLNHWRKEKYWNGLVRANAKCIANLT